MQDFINVPKCENWSIRKKPVIHIIRFTRFLKGFSSPHDYHFLYISVLDTDPYWIRIRNLDPIIFFSFKNSKNCLRAVEILFT